MDTGANAGSTAKRHSPYHASCPSKMLQKRWRKAYSPSLELSLAMVLLTAAATDKGIGLQVLFSLKLTACDPRYR